MSEPGKAVFLSYASQDAEAAKRIADALRQAGVEVWFDQEGGLEHGDEWDAKIRRQIRECVLFIPIISANTQAREEGYFRIEWELAAQRALGIASGVAFILPVVIDDTREPDALVPDRFRSVQWTKLPGGSVPPEVLQRFLKLWSHRTGALRHAAMQELEPGRPRPGGETRSEVAAPPAKTYALMAAAIAVVVLGIGWWFLRGPSAPPTPTAATAAVTPPAPAAPPLSEARQLAEKARAMFDSLDGTRDDYKLAEELIAQAKARDATDAEVCAAEAQLHERFLQRGWDTSDARREAARAAVQRAIRLDPQSFEARWAQVGLLAYTGSEGEEKVRQLRALRSERPADKRVLRLLGSGLDRLGRLEEAIPIFDESAALPGGDPLSLYSKSQALWFAGRTAEAEAAIEASIAQKPFTGALLMNVWYKTSLHGDLDSARSILNRINPAELMEDRASFFAFYIEWLARRPDAALARLAAVPRDWLNDNFHRGPKAMLVGDAQKLAGRPDAAALEWRAALKLVDQRLAASPNEARLLGHRFGLLIRLGQREEAERQLNLLIQVLGSNPDGTPVALSRAYTLLGRKAEAISQISAGLKRDKRAVLFTAADLRLNPEWDPLRGEPGFQRVIEEAEAIEAAAAGKSEAAPKADLSAGSPVKVDDKSVAVLAFANLSDEKANEYFSDGISEELLNVLAKVPGLKVSARTSAFYFKGKEVPVPEIARQLGVAYVVEGSVRKQGDKVRITAQLIKASDGFHVWSDTFTRELKDIFAVQDEIAGLIAKNLQLKLGAGNERESIRPEIYELLLQARASARQQSTEGRKQAIALYRRALATEPRLAAAWAEMAHAYVALGRFGGLPIAEGMREARAAAQHALALDPDQPAGLGALALVQRTADWDWRGAQRSIQRAMELAPGDPGIMSDAAVLFFNVGRVEEAITLAKQAVERDPLNVSAQFYLGVILEINGQFEESLRPLAKAVELAPAADEYHTHVARSLISLGRLAEAAKLVALEPNEAYRLVGLAQLRHAQGDQAGAVKSRDELIARYGAEIPGYVALTCAVLGDKEQAFAWLDRALAGRDAAVVWIKTNYYLRSLHSDPRWHEFLAKLGLSDEQLK